MHREIWKSASALAIATAASLFAAGAASAADLGGSCCADLEERIAELEATTVRKGNRKVSLSVSGFVGQQVMFWNDGTQKDMYIGDGGNIFSRFRFTGAAKVSPSITVGFTYEFGANPTSIGSMNQLNGGDKLGGSGVTTTACGGSAANVVAASTIGCATIRDETVWIKHEQLGKIKIGQGSTATDNLVLIDVGMMGAAGTPDHALYMGNFIIRGNNGRFANFPAITWALALRGHESWDTNRREHVLYETPTLAGFTLQAAVAADNYWDVALRYAGDLAGFRIAGGIGYQEDSDFNGTSQLFNQTGVICSINCTVKTKEIKGALSVMHMPTGLFVTGSAGNRELSGTDGRISAGSFGRYTGPDARYWHIAGGVSKNFFGIGNTVAFIEYGEHKGGLAQATYLSVASTLPNLDHCSTPTAASNCDSTVTNWGLGLVQYIDAAAMEIFATYKNYSLDSTGFQAAGGNAALNNNAGGVHDLQIFMLGTRINF